VKNSKEWVAIHGMSAIVGRKPDAMEVLEKGQRNLLGVGTADVRARPTDDRDSPRAMMSSPPRAELIARRRVRSRSS